MRRLPAAPNGKTLQSNHVSEKSFGELIASYAGYGAYLTALLFFGGFLYLYVLWIPFGLSPITLEIPASGVIVQTPILFLRILREMFGAAERHLGPLLILLIAAVGGTFAVLTVKESFWYRRKYRYKRSVHTAVVPPRALNFLALSYWLLLFVTFAFMLLPVLMGIRDARREFIQPKIKITLYVKSLEEHGLGKTLLDANRMGRLRLIFQTKDLVAVYALPRKGNHDQAFIFSRSTLDGVSTMPLR